MTEVGLRCATAGLALVGEKLTRVADGFATSGGGSVPRITGRARILGHPDQALPHLAPVFAPDQQGQKYTSG
jgi:hypothetical protein